MKFTNRKIPPQYGHGVIPGARFLGGLTAPSPGTFSQYRTMRSNPTLSLARAVGNLPIKTAELSVESDDIVYAELVRSTLDTHCRRFVRESVNAIDFGFQAFEVAWRATSGMKTEIDEIRPLLPDLTQAILDNASGKLMGLRNGGVDIYNGHFAWVTIDKEGDDPYGRSRMENIRRTAYRGWEHVFEKMFNYIDKGAGIIPMVTFPSGKSAGADGTELENSTIATELVRKLSKAEGIIRPWELMQWAEDLARRGVGNIESLLSWKFDFLETRAGHGTEFLAMMEHFEKLMMRGWLVPERTATEGKHGTKAEAEAHAEVSLGVAQETLDEILRVWNGQVVDELLVRNFGRLARGKAKVVASPLASDERQMYRELLQPVLSDPNNLDLMVSWLDVDAMIDLAGYAKATNTIDPQEMLDQRAMQALPPVGPPGVPSVTGPGAFRRILEHVAKENGIEMSHQKPKKVVRRRTTKK